MDQIIWKLNEFTQIIAVRCSSTFFIVSEIPDIMIYFIFCEMFDTGKGQYITQAKASYHGNKGKEFKRDQAVKKAEKYHYLHGKLGSSW